MKNFYYTLFFLFLFPFFFGVKNVYATKYYVSYKEGNDSYDGLSETVDGLHGPWKTISKVNNSTFSPGDSILFKRGDAWNEYLVVSSSGNSNSNIYYGDYGSGDKPVINCADTITGWSVHSGNIWSASLGYNITSVPQIFMDGKRQIVSRWPNRGWNTIDKTSTTAYYLYDESLSQVDDYWKGATLQIRDCDWAVEDRTITSSSSGANTIRWDDALSWSLKARTGYGYYMENKLALVDTVGEWYFDVKTHTLYLQMAPSDNPNNHVIEASIRSVGIKGTYKHYITLENFDIRKSANRAIDYYGGQHLNIHNNNISGSFSRGIYSINGTFNSIYSNTIEDNKKGFAISVSGLTSSIINGNTINGIAFDSISVRTGEGIVLVNFEGDVCDNYITNVSYNGIRVLRGTVHVYNNEIYHCMLYFSDGGGIYLNGDQTGSIIEKNYIHDLSGSFSGTPKTSGNATIGLYFDETGSRGAVFSYNVISDCAIGVYLHKSYNTKILNNTFYNSNFGMNFYEEVANQMYGNTVKNNICYSTGSSKYAMRILRRSGSTNSIGEFNNNLYYNPQTTDVIQYSWTSFYTLSEWQSKTGLDAGNDANSVRVDPLLKDAANGNFHLTSASPCIDAGEDVGLDEDFEGLNVPFGSYPDIGAYEFTGSSVGVRMINDKSLLQAYPNPFCNKINIEFQLEKKEKVHLTVFGSDGKKYCQLISRELMPGLYKEKWEAMGNNPGVYIIKLRIGKNEMVKKVILIKKA